jgi:phage shock protein PspC (stress-responsive transcriptional regulator)
VAVRIAEAKEGRMNEEYVQQPIGTDAGMHEQASPQENNGWTRVVDTNDTQGRTEQKRMDNGSMNNEINNGTSNNGGNGNGATVTQLPNMLYRHPSQKVVGGVCGGLADFLGWDPVLVRILWVVATIATGGGGFLAYAALWVMLPVGTVSGGQERPPAIEMNDRNLRTAAYLLIGLGLLWFLSNVGILPWMWSGFWSVVGLLFWPALLIGAGFLLLNRNGNTDWRTNLRTNMEDVSDRLRSTFSSRAPSSDEVKSGLSSARQRIPFKRSQSDRILMGVCGGIGQRFGIEPNLVRLIWAAFTIGSVGTGALLYIAMGLLVPEENGLNGHVHNGSHEDAQDVPVVDDNTANGNTVL